MTFQTQLQLLRSADGTQIAWHAHRPPAAPRASAVVLTNGIGTTAAFWRYLVEELMPDHRVSHWDYRGHGSSGLSAGGDYSLQTQAEDLQRVTTAVMTEAGAEAPVHVAFSMGVAVLLELYRVRPELVRAMVLIGGTPEAPGSGSFLAQLPGAMQALRTALAVVTPLTPLLQRPLKALVGTGGLYPVGRALGLLRRHAPREDIDDLLNEIAAMDPTAYWLTLRGLMAADASDVLPRVRVPVLIVAAKNDQLAPLRQLRLMSEALPHAQLVEIDDAGHAVLLEAGPAVAAQVGRFVRALQPPRAAPA